MNDGASEWRAWSDTVNEAFEMTDEIAKAPASDLPGIAIKLGAIAWALDDMDAILDRKGARQLRRLASEAARLAHS